MKMIFTGKVSGEKTVLAAGARHTVKAQAGEQYGLVDEVTGLVPDGVEADRSGDDLILRKKEDSTEVRIEGFWEECQPGETQCTAVFNVVGENGQVTEAVLTQDGPVLENFTAGQSGTLAGGINNGIIWGGIAFGAGLAAIALAAGGGGGSSRHKRTAEGEQKPVQPEGGQETGSSTGSTKPESGNSSGHVNDADGNGKPDSQDAQEALDAAEDLVAKAEEAEKVAEDALKAAGDVIDQPKHDDLTAKHDAVVAAKTPAEAAVNNLPEGPEKEALKGRLDAVDGIQVPAVNDADGNGKPDSQDAQEALDAAEDLVAKAEEAEKVAEDALKAAGDVIDQPKHDDLTAKHDAVVAAKTPAEAAVNNLPEGPEKEALKGRLDAVDGIQVPAVNDADGNGKPDSQDQQEAFNNAKAHLEKALNTVYQPNDDLYAVYKFGFNKPTGNPEASTTSWREVLNQNGVSGFSVEQGHDGSYRYIYNGLDGDDVISTAYSVGGTGRTMVSRNDMVINTNAGDDIISVGMDYGRSYSAGYTDKKYVTNMRAGDDIMMIGLGNNKVGVHLRDDLSLRIVDRDDTINNGELLFPVSQYDKGTGGIISSTTINMGDGNDTLLACGYEEGGKAIVNSNIDLGAGNDIIHVNGDVEAVNIKGGAGMDTLAISHGTLTTTDFSGFEVIELGDNNGGINVIASALVHSGVDAIEGGILKITGTSNTRVNLDGNDWKFGGPLSEDGVNYNVYTHDAAPGIKILIDEHITNVM
ncbi:hypothetical protein KZ288_22650 [Escherichia coli]|uniref:coiled-coil domain-containing protein n=1 Tax=Escherichia coli TaxID=562 RepID=UPI001ED9F658|nr:calcium-binding protein [Escherichia coli]MCG3016644.1 hypothetical protein [Escherichia coli]